MKDKFLNVLLAGNNYHVVGGSDRVLLETEKLLIENGNKVIPFAAVREKNINSIWSRYFPTAIDTGDASVLDIPRFLYSRNASKNINLLLSEIPIDIAHLHIYNGGLTTSILNPLIKRGIPVIQSLHEYRLSCPVYTHISNDKICNSCEGQKFWKAIPRKCNRNSFTKTVLSVTETYFSRYMGSVSKVDHFIAVSAFMKSKMIENNIDEHKISVIHNFIAVTKQRPLMQSNSNYFLYFGRVERVKGMLTLIKAFEILPSIDLIIVGEGSMMTVIESELEARQLNNVSLVGFKQGTELENLIENCIGTILPSEWYENCPMSILESFAFGKPVIGTRIGGIPELINDGKDGFLIEVANVNELSEKIKWMHINRSQSYNMGLKGYEKMLNEFSPPKHYEKLKMLYTKILAHR